MGVGGGGWVLMLPMSLVFPNTSLSSKCAVVDDGFALSLSLSSSLLLLLLSLTSVCLSSLSPSLPRSLSLSHIPFYLFVILVRSEEVKDHQGDQENDEDDHAHDDCDDKDNNDEDDDNVMLMMRMMLDDAG